MGIRATQPDGSPIITHTKCDIIEGRLPAAAKIGYKFNTVKQNFVSIPVLCDNSCEVLLTEDDIKVTRNGIQVMDGYREPSTRLWRFQLNNHKPCLDDLIKAAQNTDGFEHHVNAFVPEGTVADTISFLHKALFSPSTSTLLQAIKNNHLTTWPGMTTENVIKYLPKSVATTLGHQDQTRKKERSTQPKPTTKLDPEPASDPESPNQRSHQFFSAIVDLGTGKMYTDQTGRFPVTSS
jgi:hypothetical protein